MLNIDEINNKEFFCRGCSDFLLSNSPSSVISARTMDYNIQIQAEVVSVPRGKPFISSLSPGEDYMKWTSKYGFVGTNVLHSLEFTDGLNEKGLSVATLWLEASKYPDVHGVPRDKTITIVELASWLLGSFSTVEEVVLGIKGVFVIGKSGIESPNVILPLHIAIHDSNKRSVVIEFVGGKIQVYKNFATVLTNDPSLPKQVKNLKFYLRRINKCKKLGLPGGSSSLSRFVLIHMLNRLVRRSSNDREAIMNALHILNRVTMVNGECCESSTQYQIIRDHKNLIYYINDNNNMNLRALDLKKLDFDANAQMMKISVANDRWFISANEELEPALLK